MTEFNDAMRSIGAEPVSPGMKAMLDEARRRGARASNPMMHLDDTGRLEIVPEPPLTEQQARALGLEYATAMAKVAGFGGAYPDVIQAARKYADFLLCKDGVADVKAAA